MALDPELNTRSSIFVDLNTQRSMVRELAWAQFHDRYAPIIRGFARKLATPTSDLDDLVQDVMLGFYSVSPRWTYDRSKGRFRGFIKKCVLSALGKLRRRKRPDLGGDEFNPQDKRVEETWIKVWEKELLNAAVDEARNHSSPLNYQIFQRYVIDDQPPQQVAAELSVSLDQVYQAKARLKAVISELLDRFEEEYG